MAHAITPGVVIGFVTAGLSVMSLLFGGLIAGLGVAVLTAIWRATQFCEATQALRRFTNRPGHRYLYPLGSGSAVPSKAFSLDQSLGLMMPR